MTKDFVEGAEGEWNEASWKMKRIDDSWRFIDAMRMDLLGYNAVFRKYNYELIFSKLISQCQEIVDLMDSNELKEFKGFRGKATLILCDNKVFKRVARINAFGSTGTRTLFTQENWDKTRELLFSFEDFTRSQIGKHGLANPKKKSASKAAIR